MGRKVLISFLGTGPFESKETRTYKTARYHLGDADLGDYSFVSAALKEYYQIDKVILIGTVHSMWEEVYRWFSVKSGKFDDENTYFDIAETCEKANHLSELVVPHQDAIEQSIGKDSKIVLIKYGITEQEIKKNESEGTLSENNFGKNRSGGAVDISTVPQGAADVDAVPKESGSSQMREALKGKEKDAVLDNQEGMNED